MEEMLIWRYQNKEDSCSHRFGCSHLQGDYKKRKLNSQGQGLHRVGEVRITH